MNALFNVINNKKDLALANDDVLVLEGDPVTGDPENGPLTSIELNEGWNLVEIQHISNHSTLKALESYLETDKNETFNKYRELFKKEVVC